MILLTESAAAAEMTKAVMCPKCRRGRLANIPEWCDAVLPKRGSPPPGSGTSDGGVQVKCLKCRTLWILTMTAAA